MPAVITRGKTFGATETVTNTKLHQLVDSATIAGIDGSNMASGSGVVVRSTSAPSNTDSLWVDTNQSPPVLKRYTGAEWQPTGSFALLTNKSGSTRSAGDVVVADTTADGCFTTSTSGADIKVIGIVMESIANNSEGVVALSGARVTNINCDAAVSRGQFLKSSTTAAKASPTSTGEVGVFAIALSSLGSAGALAEALLIGCNVIAAITATNYTSSILTPKEYTDGADTSTSDESTVSTTYVDTTLTLTNTTGKQGLNHVVFSGRGDSSSGIAAIGLLVDGTVVAEAAIPSGVAGCNVFLAYNGVLSAGSHTVKVQQKGVGGGSCTLKGTLQTSRLNWSYPT